MPKYPPLQLDWTTIKNRFEAGESPADLGREFGCNPTVIYNRIRRNNWQKPIRDNPIRPKLKDRLNAILDALPSVRPNTALEKLQKHVDMLHTLVASAQKVEGWSDIPASVTNVLVLNQTKPRVRRISVSPSEKSMLPVPSTPANP